MHWGRVPSPSDSNAHSKLTCSRAGLQPPMLVRIPRRGCLGHCNKTGLGHFLQDGGRQQPRAVGERGRARVRAAQAVAGAKEVGCVHKLNCAACFHMSASLLEYYVSAEPLATPPRTKTEDCPANTCMEASADLCPGCCMRHTYPYKCSSARHLATCL